MPGPHCAVAPLFLCFAILAVATGQAPSPSPFPVFTNKNGTARRLAKSISSFSTSGLITSFLRRTPAVASTLPALERLIYSVDRAVTENTLTAESENANSEGSDGNAATLTTCNHRSDEWKNALTPYHLSRGLPVPDTDCQSDIYADPRGESFFGMSEDEAYVAVRDHAAALNGAAKGLVEEWRRADPALRAQLTNWTDAPTSAAGDTVVPEGDTFAARPAEFSYAVRDQRCTFDHVAFGRAQKNWFLLVSLTNAPKDIVKQDGRREYIHEFVPLSDSKSGAPVPLGAAPREFSARNITHAGGPIGDWIRGTTTIRQFDKGPVTASAFTREFPRDNLAVQEALKRGEHHTQQASDATTLSNIAILAFPLVMNAVPVALIAEVNTLGTLAYTLLTDVLTAVPLAIKGVEVLNIGRQRNRAVIVRVTGGNLPAPGTGTDNEGNPIYKAGEAWVAECRPTGSFHATGVALLVVAITFMAGGIVAEVWARDYVKRKRKAAEAAASAVGGGAGGIHGGGAAPVALTTGVTNTPASVALHQRPIHPYGHAHEPLAQQSQLQQDDLGQRPTTEINEQGAADAAGAAAAAAGVVAIGAAREARRSSSVRDAASSGADAAGGNNASKVA